jgi:hypothetical protein
VLTGWLYFTRLSEGSANGLPMLHLEYAGTTFDTMNRDFYRSGDGRERFDLDSRKCRERPANGSPGRRGGSSNCTRNDDLLDALVFRTFTGGPLNGRSRAVVFAWSPGKVGGPSARCGTEATCDQSYAMELVSESGVVTGQQVTLPHVVNVLDVPVGGNGQLILRDLPDVSDDTHVHGFVFNSARPGAASLNWDAIFPATVLP